MNAVERELRPTRVLNPNPSEASYKPKQRSYRKTKLEKKKKKKKIFGGILVGGILSEDFIREPREATSSELFMSLFSYAEEKHIDKISPRSPESIFYMPTGRNLGLIFIYIYIMQT